MENNARLKVAYCGGEGLNWALDHDLQHVQRITRDFVEVVDVGEADLIHSVWWRGVLHVPEVDLRGKRIIASIADDPKTMMGAPEYLGVRKYVTAWLSEYSESQHFVTQCGQPCFVFPDPIDLEMFQPPVSRQNLVLAMKHKLGIDPATMLIGNFHKDSSMSDLSRPKKQKGADILLEIMSALVRRELDVHLLLAGPRRHWIRNELKKRNIPYSFIGKEVKEDDLEVNTLELSEIAKLFQSLDVYLIPSRWEGAPNTLLEAAATKTKIISTPVGQVEDMLSPRQIFRNVNEAAEMVEADIRSGYLETLINPAYEYIQKWNTDEALADRLRYIYGMTMRMPPQQATSRPRTTFLGRWLADSSSPKANRSLNDRFRKSPLRGRELSISIWHEFQKPPYGGGNQFLLALEAALKRKGHEVKRNNGEHVDVHLLHALWFNEESFQSQYDSKKSVVLHRIDGPIQIYRGSGREQDEQCQRLNHKYADATVMQSGWSMKHYIRLGLDVMNPVLIKNSVDPQLFNEQGRSGFSRDKKIKLISTSWSKNLRKGFEVYRHLDQYLDTDRYEYTFVGRLEEADSFQNIKIIDPVDSETLAEILKQHDIYITASKHDPCSNALCEALACGLPALYLNAGGHPEIVEHGGVAFESTQDVMDKLDQLARGYDHYRNLIWIPTMDEVADQYLETAIHAMALK